MKRIKVTTDGTDPTTSGTATTFNAASASVDVSADGTTTVKWVAEDNVGNVSTVSSQVVKLDTTAPSAPTGFAFSSLTQAYYPGSGSIVYFQGGGAGGFTIAASGSADAHSGVAGYTYPALGTGLSHTAGDYTFTSGAATTQSGDVTAQNGAGLSSTGTSFTAQIDSAAPTSSIQCNTAACSAGWYTVSPVSIAIGATDGGAGVKRITYTTDGSNPTSSGTATTVNAAPRAST